MSENQFLIGQPLQFQHLQYQLHSQSMDSYKLYRPLRVRIFACGQNYRMRSHLFDRYLLYLKRGIERVKHLRCKVNRSMHHNVLDSYHARHLANLESIQQHRPKSIDLIVHNHYLSSLCESYSLLLRVHKEILHTLLSAMLHSFQERGYQRTYRQLVLVPLQEN